VEMEEENMQEKFNLRNIAKSSPRRQAQTRGNIRYRHVWWGNAQYHHRSWEGWRGTGWNNISNALKLTKLLWQSVERMKRLDNSPLIWIKAIILKHYCSICD
jgi:hypothetical protein